MYLLLLFLTVTLSAQTHICYEDSAVIHNILFENGITVSALTVATPFSTPEFCPACHGWPVWKLDLNGNKLSKKLTTVNIGAGLPKMKYLLLGDNELTTFPQLSAPYYYLDLHNNKLTDFPIPYQYDLVGTICLDSNYLCNPPQQLVDWMATQRGTNSWQFTQQCGVQVEHPKTAVQNFAPVYYYTVTGKRISAPGRAGIYFAVQGKTVKRLCKVY